jgi:hypothetical protein
MKRNSNNGTSKRVAIDCPPNKEKTMRKLILSALLGFGAFGATDVNQANASWLSEVLNNSQIQVK